MGLNHAFKSTMILAFVSLAGCGGKTDSDRVDVTILPSKPIVFTSPITYTSAGGTAVTVAGPWMRFQLSVNVPADLSSPITVIHVNVQASGTDQNGIFKTVNADFDPALDNYSTATGDICTYSDYGEFDPAGTSSGGSDGKTFNNTGLFELPSTSTGCRSGYPVFYVGGLPGSNVASISNPGQLNNYTFNVMVTPEGWFGTRTLPTDRFQKSVYATTQ